MQLTRNLWAHDDARLRAGLPPGDRLRGVQVCGQTMTAGGTNEMRPATKSLLFSVAAGTLSACAVGRNRLDADTRDQSLVARERFQFSERPRAESGSPQLPIRVDPVADSVEGLELYRSPATNGFRDDCLGDTVVHVTHPALLPPGEPLQDPLGGSSAFGLEIRSARRELFTDMHCLSTGEKMSRGCNGEVVRAAIHADSARRLGSDLGLLLNGDVNVEVPPATDERCGSGFLPAKSFCLVSPNQERDFNAVVENGQRHGLRLRMVGKDFGVVVDAPRLELLGEPSFSLAPFESIRNAGDSADGKIRGEPELLSRGIVDEFVKFVLVEHSFSEGNGKDIVASASKYRGGLGESLGDLRRGIQFADDCSLSHNSPKCII